MGAPEVFGRAGEAPTITLRHPRRLERVQEAWEDLVFETGTLSFWKLCYKDFELSQQNTHTGPCSHDEDHARATEVSTASGRFGAQRKRRNILALRNQFAKTENLE